MLLHQRVDSHILLSAQILFACTLESVEGCTTLSLTLMCTQRVSFLRFGYALGLEKGSQNPNVVAITTTLRACGTTVRILKPLFFLAFTIRFSLELGKHNISNALMIFLP